ncbi:glutaredoxin family protein [Alkalihalobacillus pseudalcaliphilus]|uniref:glutaredoxin family protein n=1 Tax=Alkalihalobacillus pseudalcaliphilus TaxID=79884 RepID=UPI00064DC35D|nr:glutaredoxin domain-containing protein [Alkalihalobacillus pseudalcaliphilus]KMK76322.1 glutaredoxin [Alkalihalobacillus pseudalcaliphilus]
MKFELYTRPTCSDCQAAKKFLSQNNIDFLEFDLTKVPEKEEELKKVSGARIVPTFVFKETILGLPKKSKVFIGFENNFDEIKGKLGLS